MLILPFFFFAIFMPLAAGQKLDHIASGKQGNATIGCENPRPITLRVLINLTGSVHTTGFRHHGLTRKLLQQNIPD